MTEEEKRKARAAAVARCRKNTRKQYSFEVRTDDPIAIWLDGQASKQGTIKKALRRMMATKNGGL